MSSAGGGACRRDQGWKRRGQSEMPTPPAGPLFDPEIVPSQSSSLCVLASASQSSFRCISGSTPPTRLLSSPSACPLISFLVGVPQKGWWSCLWCLFLSGRTGPPCCSHTITLIRRRKGRVEGWLPSGPGAPQPLVSQGAALQPAWEALGPPPQQSALPDSVSLSA